MDAIADWWYQVTQSSVWQKGFGQLAWIDWLALFLMTVGFVYGARKGLSAMFSKLLQIIVIITATLEFYVKISDMIRYFFANFPNDLMMFTSFAAAAVFFWIIATLVLEQLGKLFAVQVSQSLRILGGAIGGMVYAFFFLGLVTQAILLGPWSELKVSFDKDASRSGYYLAQTAPKIHAVVTKPIRFVTSRL